MIGYFLRKETIINEVKGLWHKEFFSSSMKKRKRNWHDGAGRFTGILRLGDGDGCRGKHREASAHKAGIDRQADYTILIMLNLAGGDCVDDLRKLEVRLMDFAGYCVG
jgi:hypothetical protein